MTSKCCQRNAAKSQDLSLRFLKAQRLNFFVEVLCIINSILKDMLAHALTLCIFDDGFDCLIAFFCLKLGF